MATGSFSVRSRVHRVRPELVAEVNYLTWDADNAPLSASGPIPALHSETGASGTGSSNPACSSGESDANCASAVIDLAILDQRYRAFYAFDAQTRIEFWCRWCPSTGGEKLVRDTASASGLEGPSSHQMCSATDGRVALYRTATRWQFRSYLTATVPMLGKRRANLPKLLSSATACSAAGLARAANVG
jgi:hypothetical protein